MDSLTKKREGVTIADALESYEQLLKLRQKIGILTVHGSDPNVGRVIENLGLIFSERAKIEHKAVEFFEAIGKQICSDNNIPWGSKESDKLSRDTQLSASAADKLQVFLNFVEENL